MTNFSHNYFLDFYVTNYVQIIDLLSLLIISVYIVYIIYITVKMYGELNFSISVFVMVRRVGGSRFSKDSPREGKK